MVTSSRRLPPSERDFEIYRAMAVDSQSTREVAEELNLSQTRVVQIRKSVGLWIADEVPDSGDLTEVQKVRLAEYLAEERFIAMYSESMSAWRRSQGVKTIEREGASGTVKTTREVYGETKYLQQAMRITVAQATWWRKGKKEGTGSRGQETGAYEGLKQALQDEPAVAPMNPPDEDCSVAAEVTAPAAAVFGMPVAASDCAGPTCDAIEARRREFLAALEDDTSPVQPPVTDRSGMQMEEQAEETEQVLLPLNRQQRRARQRKLERALARKAK
jgi:hypothetical protein